MLVLTRRIGESIRIGDDVRLTIRSKLRAHLMVSLVASADLLITDDTDVTLNPTSRRRCSKRYLIAMLAGDHIRIGNVVVVLLGRASDQARIGQLSNSQVRVGINAPLAIQVHREEVYWRIRHTESMRAIEAT